MDRDNSPEESSISKMSKRKGERSDNSPDKTDVERRKERKKK